MWWGRQAWYASGPVSRMVNFRSDWHDGGAMRGNNPQPRLETGFWKSPDTGLCERWDVVAWPPCIWPNSNRCSVKWR